MRRTIGCLGPLLLLGLAAGFAHASDGTRIVLRFPRGLGPGDVVVLAEGSLHVGRDVVVKPDKTGRGVMVNLGQGATVVETGAKVAGIASKGPVRLSSGVEVTGDVLGAGRVEVGGGAKIGGATRAWTLLEPVVERPVGVPVAGARKGDVVVAKDQKQTLNPGTYASIWVRDGGTLLLGSGEFFAGSLRVDGGASLSYSGDEYSPAVVFVSGATMLRGKVEGKDATAHLLLVPFAARRLEVAQSFSASVFAPRARLVLGGRGVSLRGGFAARDIDVRAGTTLLPFPFALDRYQGRLRDPDDDRDGVPDHLDACPADPTKVKPGACGCGVPDEDGDKDGIPDCLDRFRRAELPLIPPGKLAMQGCRVFPWRESTYWFCGERGAGGLARQEAASACEGAGMSLVELASPEERRFLTRLLVAPVWVGGVESPREAKACRALDDATGDVMKLGCRTRIGFACQYGPMVFGMLVASGREPPALACVESSTASPPAVGATCDGVTSPLPCDEVEICPAAPSQRATLVSSQASQPRIVPAPKLFPEGQPRLGWSKAYGDPPTGKGVDHAWCKMSTQDPTSLAVIRHDGLSRGVRATAGEGLAVTLTPDVTFEAKPVPYPWGEVEPNLRGRVTFKADADLKGVAGIDQSVSLVRGTLEIVGTRCGLRAGMTELRVLGSEVPRPGEIPRIDTDDPKSPLHAKAAACESALRRFLRQADRTKKAFRDTQQLAWQLRQPGTLDESPLCSSMRSADPIVESFPGGPECWANEQPESIFNRFRDYYEGAGIGETNGLRSAANEVARASADFGSAAETMCNRDFTVEVAEVSRPVASVPVVIDGIAVAMRINLTVRLALSGRFEVDWKFPLWLAGPPTGTDRLLRVAAAVAPKVTASLSATIEADSASVRTRPGMVVEPTGSVTLVEATLPMLVDVALERQTVLDPRPLPEDVRPGVAKAGDAFVFETPKRYRFSVAHQHGAGVDARSLLGGTLAGRVRVPMGAFQRILRRTVLDTRGVSGHFDLAGADTASGQLALRRSVPGADVLPSTSTWVVEGIDAVGISEPELPLMSLAYASEYGPRPPGPRRSMDISKLGRAFYDDLCRPKPGEACEADGRRAVPCQIYSTCEAQGGAATGMCRVKCRGENVQCKRNQDCCAGLVCDMLKRCARAE